MWRIPRGLLRLRSTRSPGRVVGNSSSSFLVISRFFVSINLPRLGFLLKRQSSKLIMAPIDEMVKCLFTSATGVTQLIVGEFYCFIYRLSIVILADYRVILLGLTRCFSAVIIATISETARSSLSRSLMTT